MFWNFMSLDNFYQNFSLFIVVLKNDREFFFYFFCF